MSGECTGEDWKTQTFGWVDYTVFGATLLVSVGIGIFYGFFSAGKQKTTAEFLMGNKQMNFITLGISLTVGFTSAIAVLGNASEMYNYGTQYLTMMVSFVVMVPCTVYLFLPVFRELGITSIYEYLDRRFHNAVRLLVAFLYLLMMLMYLSVVVYAPALALRQVTGLETMYAVAIIFAVGILYSSLGGLKAVVWSDVFQAAVIISAIIMVLVRGSIIDGGPGRIWKDTYDSGRVEFFNIDPDPRVRHTLWSTMIGASFYWVGMNGATQTSLQRLLSVPTQRDAAKAMWLSCLGMFLIYTPTFYLGLMMYTHFRECDPLLSKSVDASDQLLPLYVMDVAGTLPGLPGLFVAGVFSAALSTVASGLNAVSACMLRDFLDGGFGYRPPDNRAALVTRCLCALFGLCSFALTFLVAQLGGVLQIAISFNGMLIGVVLGVFTLAMYVPWSNTKGVIIGALVGLSIVLWLGMGAQVATIEGRLVHPKKMVGTNCTCEVNIPPDVSQDAVFDGYRISYFWYSPMGWVITVVAGVLASGIFGWQDFNTLDSNLLAPIIRKWFIKKKHGISNRKTSRRENGSKIKSSRRESAC